MRIAGVVLLVLSAFIIVPALTYVGYLRLKGGFADPAGLKTWFALIVAAVGACVGGIGVTAVLVSREEPPSR